jgi:hypothetical protein
VGNCCLPSRSCPNQYDSEIYRQKRESGLGRPFSFFAATSLSSQLDPLRRTDTASVNQLADWNFAPEFWPVSFLNALGILFQDDIVLILR